MICDAADLDAPNPGADPVMARFTRQLVEQGGHARRTLADRVRELVDGVRRDLVARYVQSQRPLSEVSARLDFNAPSAFSRWHRRQFGRAARDAAQKAY